MSRRCRWVCILVPTWMHRYISFRMAKVLTPCPWKPRFGELEPHRIQMGERILFKTINSTHYWQTDAFEKNFVFISKEAAEYLGKVRVQTIGVDYLSVGGYFKDGPETHRALLGAGIWIIEGLNLAAVAAGEYELICLPVKLTGSEGAPARAILKKL